MELVGADLHAGADSSAFLDSLVCQGCLSLPESKEVEEDCCGFNNWNFTMRNAKNTLIQDETASACTIL